MTKTASTVECNWMEGSPQIGEWRKLSFQGRFSSEGTLLPPLDLSVWNGCQIGGRPLVKLSTGTWPRGPRAFRSLWLAAVAFAVELAVRQQLTTTASDWQVGELDWQSCGPI